MWPLLFVLQAAIHQWNYVDGKFWQIKSQGEPRQDLSQGTCAPGMLHVRGKMVQDRDPNPWGTGTVEYLQKTTCTEWINKEFPERCRVFDRASWLSIQKTLKTKPMEFCIDQFEYPNRKHEYPMIFVNFDEAAERCALEGKRLCNEDEWTFACEGEEAKPYPYGYVRDDKICVIDWPYIAYNGKRMRPRNVAFLELDRLWQGKASGIFSQCRSDFGVFDLTGNVDEWTTKIRPEGKYKSILKGGYWGRVRTRCRPSTRGHNENHIFYQQGFRCCSEVK